MPFHQTRRALALAACASSLLLAACGSSSIEQPFVPTRAIAFGDGFADLGQTSNSVNTNARYTVNVTDGSNDIWTQQLALDYNVVLGTTALTSTGTSYATGNARVNTHPDAAGNSATPTVKEQIDAFLANGTLGAGDLTIVSAGIADVVAEVAKAAAGTQTNSQALANVAQAGRDLGTQIRRLVTAGATHVVVVGTYDLSRSPWAVSTPALGTLLSSASTGFNDGLLLSIVDLGANVLYADSALYFNLVTGSPASYGFTDAITPVCTVTDPGQGIGTGTGQVNSALCTVATATNIAAGASYTTYVFADRVYPGPVAHRLFGDYAYSRLRSRW